MIQTKICGKCGKTLPTDQFYSRKDRSAGPRSKCKKCHAYPPNRSPESVARRRQHARNRYQKQSERYKNKHLKHCYGMTGAEFMMLLNTQRGVCAICGNLETVVKRRLAVDHNHQTGFIRGLLCTYCNIGLGAFKDSITLLTKAANYLSTCDGFKLKAFNCCNFESFVTLDMLLKGLPLCPHGVVMEQEEKEDA